LCSAPLIEKRFADQRIQRALIGLGAAAAGIAWPYPLLFEVAGSAIRQSRRRGYFFLADLGAAFFADRVFLPLVAFEPLFAAAVFLLAVFFTAIGCSPQPNRGTRSTGAKLPADTIHFLALDAFLAPAFFFAPVFLTDFFAPFFADFFAAMV
jgi:hypothetical protein